MEWSTGVRDRTQDDVHVVVSTEEGAKIGARWVVACDGAWRAYGAVDGDLVLIRPDGHIGIRSTDEAAVTDYLAAVLPSRDLSGVGRP